MKSDNMKSDDITVKTNSTRYKDPKTGIWKSRGVTLWNPLSGGGVYLRNGIARAKVFKDSISRPIGYCAGKIVEGSKYLHDRRAYTINTFVGLPKELVCCVIDEPLRDIGSLIRGGALRISVANLEAFLWVLLVVTGTYEAEKAAVCADEIRKGSKKLEDLMEAVFGGVESFYNFGSGGLGVITGAVNKQIGKLILAIIDYEISTFIKHMFIDAVKLTKLFILSRLQVATYYDNLEKVMLFIITQQIWDKLHGNSLDQTRYLQIVYQLVDVLLYSVMMDQLLQPYGMSQWSYGTGAFAKFLIKRVIKIGVIDIIGAQLRGCVCPNKAKAKEKVILVPALDLNDVVKITESGAD